MKERNYDCNVGAENFPSVEEQEENNKTRNLHVSLVTLSDLVSSV